MSRSFGNGSKYLVKKENKFLILALVSLGAALILDIWILSNAGGASPIWNVFLLGNFIPIAYLLRYAQKYDNKSMKFRRGRIGENLVSDEVKKLPENYCTLLDIKFPGLWGNIDQVVIGPSGVYAIDTKSHQGHMTYNRRDLKLNGRNFEKDLLAQANRETSQLENFLNLKITDKVKVIPILAFSNPKAYMNFGLKPINGVFVIHRVWVNKLIFQRPQILTLAQTVKIQNILQEFVNK